jgi:DnaK suppressor protein
MVERNDEMKALLLKLKEETLKEINKTLKSSSDLPGGEPSGDIYDQASSERDRELGLLLSDREREKLRNIDEALLRIEEGEFGICEECGCEIPIGRLRVVPFAHCCVRCKEDLERMQAQTKRFEEDRVYNEIPFGDEEEA